MARITIRIDDALYDQLKRRAHYAGVSIADLARDGIVHVADPKSGYIYTAQDEILSTVIQALGILAVMARRDSPGTLEEGMNEARQMLAQRGLLAEEQQR
jgi:hypothetical protein